MRRGTKAQQAAYKAWNTRRRNSKGESLKVPSFKALSSKRSAAAKKAWRTRRANGN